MGNLPRHLFDSEYYYKVHPDVAKAKMDAYDHYFKFGVDEKRDAQLNYKELNLDQLKEHYYHTMPDDDKNVIGNIPFYLKNSMASHLPVLEYYASLCQIVTEFVVGHGQSTVSFLYGLPEDGKLESYDIEETPFVIWLKAKNLAKWNFIKHKKDKELQISETDLIFFNGCQSYEQLKNELELHAKKSRKFLVFHNTCVAASAIDEYVKMNKCKIVYSTNTCNGLLISEK